jgi:hypothetical protein
LESQSGSATDLRYGYDMSYRQSRACRYEMCIDVAENGMAWRDVVCYVNKIVGKLCLFGGRGVMVVGCLRLPCQDLAESVKRSAGINPDGTSPKAVVGAASAVKSKHLSFRDLAEGGNQLQLFAMMGPGQRR